MNFLHALTGVDGDVIDNMNGVYIIKNIINNKCYIGSSINIHKRLTDHRSLLIRNAHHSYKLQASVNKHGIDKFDFRVIEYTYFPEGYSKEARIEYLECLEGYYINKFNSYKKGYNVSEVPRIVGNCNTKESIIKGVKTRRERGSYMISDITRQRRSEGIKNSEKFKINRKIAALKRRKKIYQYDLDGNFIREWDCCKTASIELGICRSQILKNLSKFRYKCKSFIFSYEKHDKIDSYKNSTSKIVKRKGSIVKLYNIDGDLVNTYNNYRECAVDLSLKPSTISSYLSKSTTFRGYKLKYG